MHLMEYDDGDGLISQEELSEVIHDSSSKSALKRLNIDQLFLIELQSTLFPDTESKIGIKSVMELMMMCRGELPVTVHHLATSHAALIGMLNEAIMTLTELFRGGSSAAEGVTNNYGEFFDERCVGT